MPRLKTSFVLLASFLLVTMISGNILSAPSLYADDSYTTTTTIRVPTSCTMSGTGMGTHVAQIPNGVDSRGAGYYPDGIGKTTLKVFCNDEEGFSVYAVGYSDDTIGNTYLRDANLGSTQDILTGTTFSGANSNWAMKIGVTAGTYTPIIAGSTGDSEKQSGDTDFSNWASVPSAYARVAYRNAGTDVDSGSVYAEGSSITTTYAAYISPAQKSGVYIGQVKYTLVHPSSNQPAQPQPSTPGYITYYANSNTALGTMGKQSAADGNSVTLLASNFSRSGYGFAGWSDAYDYATNASANLYGPNEEITVPTGTTANGLSLYAIWIESAGSLQDSSKVSTLCGTGAGSLTQAPTDGTKTLASVSALTDARDNQTYTIAKLADGKCWMIENLRLETAGSNNESLSQGFGKSTTYGNFSGLATAETADFSNSTTANSLYYSGTQSGTASINIGTTDNPGYRMPRYRNTNTSSRASNPTRNTGAMYSYGNYYTWSAALANTIYYSGPTATDADGKTSETVNTSICPAGWRLPYGRNSGNGNTAGGFYYLNYKINGNSNVTNSTAVRKLRAYPNNFVYSGYVNNGSIDTRGSSGHYWSSTTLTANYAYYLYFDSDSVSPGTINYGKFYGFSVRCVLGSQFYAFYPSPLALSPHLCYNHFQYGY